MLKSIYPMMRKLRILLILIAILAATLAAMLFLVGYFKPRPGGVKIITNPTAKVYINGTYVGKTPYTSTDESEQLNLRLEADGPDLNLLPYETKINLEPGIQTVIRREFASNEEESAGEVISFERTGGKTAGLTVISNPDNAQVWIDGVSQGFTSFNFNNITTGPHRITVKNIGYKERSMNIRTLAGLKLNVYVKLAKGEDATPPPSPTSTPQSGPPKYVIIGNTSTGFLRMRTDPGNDGDEIAELKPGEKYLWLDTDSETGWHKIQYKEPAAGLPNGITGWVSNQYTTVREEGNIKEKTPAPSAAPSPGTAPLPL
jgi:hypothetical protein